MASNPIDVIVVGGGLAGVTAARDLAQTGVRTLLVEARDRLGGRTAMQTLAGQQVDTGGAYFHWFQAAIWREVMRYELPVVESGWQPPDDGCSAPATASWSSRPRSSMPDFGES